MLLIPYFTKAILSSDLHFSLQAVAVGDGTFGNLAASSDVVTASYLPEQSHILLSIFEDANQTCGFSRVLEQASYPLKGTISIPGNPEGENYGLQKRQGTSIADGSDPPICTQMSRVPVRICFRFHMPHVNPFSFSPSYSGLIESMSLH